MHSQNRLCLLATVVVYWISVLDCGRSWNAVSIRQQRSYAQTLVKGISESSGLRRKLPCAKSLWWPLCRGRQNTALAGGYGIATNYTWKEDQYELDVIVSVPSGTNAKDISFKATSTSIDLRVNSAVPTSTKNESSVGKEATSTILLDPNRALCGRINVYGTYWVISDPDDDEKQNAKVDLASGRRLITVTIEKMVGTPSDDFAIVDYDWKGVYRVEDTDEVSERKYDAAEPLDVRKYAAGMGVDIDNINMSMVDKSMFNSGLNLTQRTLEELNQSGYLASEEVTQQADGTEYVVNAEGEPVPYSAMATSDGVSKRRPVPFIDTDLLWNNTTAAKDKNETVFQQKRNFTRAAFAEDSATGISKESNPVRAKKQTVSQDPIDSLTVIRLKEILKAQGLKTSGSKSELQDRLRNQVNALLQGR